MSSRPVEPGKSKGELSPHECAFALENLEAFALDALDSVDRGIVEHHLRWCEACSTEADRFERVVESMHFAIPIGPEPLPESKSALFASISANDSSIPAHPMAIPNELASASATPGLVTSAPWWRHASIALVAPLALALVVMGVWANSLRIDLDQRNIELSSQEQLNAALSNGGQVQLYSVEQSCPKCEGSGQLGVSESNDMGMLVGWNFDPSQQHDVWGVNSQGEKKKVCQLHIDDTGAVMQMFNFPAETATFTDVYITDENGSLTYVSHLADGSDPAPADERVLDPTA